MNQRTTRREGRKLFEACRERREKTCQCGDAHEWAARGTLQLTESRVVAHVTKLAMRSRLGRRGLREDRIVTRRCGVAPS